MPQPLLDISAGSVQIDNEAEADAMDSMSLDECVSNRSPSPVAEINHEKLETKEVEKTIFSFRCRLCKEQWSTEDALLCHLTDGHGLEVEPGHHPAIYKCDQCQYVFSTTLRLVKHVAGEHGLSLSIVEPYFLDISTSVKATSVKAQRDGSSPLKRRCVSLMDEPEKPDGLESSASAIFASLSHTLIEEIPAFQNEMDSQDLSQQEKIFNSVFKSNAIPGLKHVSSGNRNTLEVELCRLDLKQCSNYFIQHGLSVLDIEIYEHKCQKRPLFPLSDNPQKLKFILGHVPNLKSLLYFNLFSGQFAFEEDLREVELTKLDSLKLFSLISPLRKPFLDGFFAMMPHLKSLDLDYVPTETDLELFDKTLEKLSLN